jgi:hypothetical protein
LTSGQQEDVAQIDIGDTISVTRTFTTGSPLTVTEELSVEGLHHRIDLRGETMTFYTAPTLVARLFTLDDAIAGELDAIRNVLAA